MASAWLAQAIGISLCLRSEFRVFFAEFTSFATRKPHGIIESSPDCNWCEANDNILDEKHTIVHCTSPGGLSADKTPLSRVLREFFSKTGSLDVSTFQNQL